MANETQEWKKRMTSHKTGTREEWLAARLELLQAEKELTRRSDELARQRQELPWVRIDKDYRFDTDEGPASLADLFRGRSQLLVYHFMFGPDYTAGLPRLLGDRRRLQRLRVHLANHDVMLWAVSRAPLAKMQGYKQRMGWSFPWASSFGSDFNSDFDVYPHRGAGACGRLRVQLPRVARVVAAGGHARAVRRVGRNDGHRLGDLHARAPGDERVRARGRGRLPHLLGLCARPGRPLGHVPVARPGAARAKRGTRPRRPAQLVPPPRRVPPRKRALGQFMGSGHVRWCLSVQQGHLP